MNGQTTGIGFEIRANVAIRIIVDRVELEPSAHTTIDHGAARRANWHAIARSAIAELGAPVVDAPAALVSRIQKKKRKQRQDQNPPPPPAPVPATATLSARRAAASGVNLEAVDVDDETRVLATVRPTPVEGQPGALACVVCHKPFTPNPIHRTRQRTCLRPKCHISVKQALGRWRRAVVRLEGGAR